MTTNPEKHVLDAIDELVNEQLAGGPVDDYSRNYYPQCSCGHDWHGVECEWCSCTSTESPTPRAIRPLTPGMRHHPLARREIDFSVLTGDENGVPYSELEEEWRRREGAIVNNLPGAPWVVYHGEDDQDGFELVGISDEEADQLDAVAGEFNRVIDQHAHEHIHQLDAEGICVWADCPVQQQPPRGYTIADLRAMQGREWRPHHYVSSVRQDYPQRYILGHEQERPRVRFWSYLAEEARFWLIEGRAEVMHITWTRGGVTVEVRLEPYGELTVDEEDTHLRPASTPIPLDMIAMEGFQDGAFTTVGYLHPDDLTIEHNREWGRAFGRDAALLQEEHRVTVTVPYREPFTPLIELLERGQ